ncbi:MAG: hypothetical protein ACI4J0_07785 [Huintestinicola sp.]|uniref:hypothetical protein n=1 Tax=Huintestinicola sp. TaxID=2981661 RepID=UPI003F1154BA
MRKFVKNNILEIFQTIYEAHSQVKKLIDKKDHESAQIVLGDCQNAAVQIGTAVESSEGEGFITVGYLEEYCEAVYEVSENISGGYSGSKAQKLLDKMLIKAENSVKNDIKVKLEIVFLPYKASMWDSMESVWKEAVTDPECDAYVVPVPYYDREPDGSFGQFRYEGGEFPSYVPVVHYEAYKFELMKPDIIYIHSPYDQYNNVTSVDPRFYSYELKKYTDMLVYIPYYVVAHENVAESMFNNSACLHADRVILQSKPLREKYIGLYSRLTDTDRSELQRRFVALGSPKFDAIVNADKNDYIIPDEWKSIIGGRKIVMYNTSITTALADTGLFMEKLRKTIEYFKDSLEYALWWRPHPLLCSTIESMRPQFLDEYRNIVSVYRQEKTGIYDDTPELQRAVILSDMYYGDYKSSVGIIYCATGKPIISAHIDRGGEISSFDRDRLEHFRDNSTLDVLKRNENYDGTAGIHIHNYIKGEVTK